VLKVDQSERQGSKVEGERGISPSHLPVRVTQSINQGRNTSRSHPPKRLDSAPPHLPVKVPESIGQAPNSGQPHLSEGVYKDFAGITISGMEIALGFTAVLLLTLCWIGRPAVLHCVRGMNSNRIRVSLAKFAQPTSRWWPMLLPRLQARLPRLVGCALDRGDRIRL
jgi:hypothetical protein